MVGKLFFHGDLVRWEAKAPPDQFFTLGQAGALQALQRRASSGRYYQDKAPAPWAE